MICDNDNEICKETGWEAERERARGPHVFCPILLVTADNEMEQAKLRGE